MLSSLSGEFTRGLLKSKSSDVVDAVPARAAQGETRRKREDSRLSIARMFMHDERIGSGQESRRGQNKRNRILKRYSVGGGVVSKQGPIRSPISIVVTAVPLAIVQKGQQ